MTPAQFALRAKVWFSAQGVTKPWVVMLANKYDNLARVPAWKAACNQQGIKFGIWMTRADSETQFPLTAPEARRACVESGAELFVAEGEIPGFRPEAMNWPELVFELKDLGIDKAVSTNWAPFVHQDGTPDATKAKALIEGGWHCLPYVYPAEHKNITIEQQAAYAKHYTHEEAPALLGPGVGWYAPQPVLGVYSGAHGSFTIDDFPSKDKCVGWSAWAAEYVI